MKRAWCTALVLALAGCQTSYTYEPIVPNPENLEMANARCNLLASSAEQGMVAWGTPEYVAGAQIGNAIGNAVRVDNFMKQCMTLQGWRRVTNAQATKQPTSLTPAQVEAAGNVLMLDIIATRCSIKVSKIGVTAINEAKRASTTEIRRSAASRADAAMIGVVTASDKAVFCKKAKELFAENQLL